MFLKEAQIAKFQIFRYNTMILRTMKTKHTLNGLILGLLLPLQAAAYFTPQEVLLSTDFYLPPTAREAQQRAENQTTTSTQRREYEQSQLEYHAPAGSNTADSNSLDEELHGASDSETSYNLPEGVKLEDILSEEDLALLNAVRLLDNSQQRLLQRVQQNQQEIAYYGTRIHGGAPPLQPTGAGGILAAITMLGAVTWTIYSVKKAETSAKTFAK